MYDSYDDKKIQDYLKPKLGKIKQGYYTPTNKEKFDFDNRKIIYRSDWELKFLIYCDNNKVVKKCLSEPFYIKYLNPIDGKVHRYFVDFYVEFANGKGVDKWLVEVKPKRHTQKPKKPKRKTAKGLKTFITMYKTYKINIAKFIAASEFAAMHGMNFGVIEVVNNSLKVIDWKKNVLDGKNY